MRYWTFAILLFTVFVTPVFSQNKSVNKDNSKAVQPPAPVKLAKRPAGEEQAIDLLTRAEGEAAGLEGKMRAWVLWQIGLAYQAIDKTKALEIFHTALVAAHAANEGGSAGKPPTSDRLKMNPHPSLPPGLLLERDIARSIVLLEPKQADETAQQIDPSIRTAILISVLSSQEKEKQFDRAMETLNRISAESEVPYEHAIRLMADLKPGQSGELTQLFLTALASYRNHAPHSQMRDAFPTMLSRFWKRLPKEIVTQAIDEVLIQAADDKGSVSYSVLSGKGGPSMRSLYEYRLSQLMPMLREFDPSAAHKYEEKYPALASNTSDPGGVNAQSDPAASTNGFQLHPGSSYPSMISSMLEEPAAQKVAAKADSGHISDAVSDAGNIRDTSLRAQLYEYIARHAAAKQDSAADDAVENMLHAAEKLQPSEAFPYYGSASEIYIKINRLDDAKQSIEAGLKVAGKLYEKDSDEDDPNTALKAFWPSTNAYCTMVRQAAGISQAWAISLLQSIKDPEIKVAAETALAGGWLKSPAGPSTIMTTNKTSNSISLGKRD
ncbi:MAG: hypothetical protein LAO78_24195 [Acidobacteriia bacterium]|nr:hypothetical protein [Terriglobia bacterium]